MEQVTKFRAWDKVKRRMLSMEELLEPVDYESLSYLDNILLRVQDKRSAWMDEPYEPYEGASNYVLMQYTGLKDKNGVEIYEGDIVRYFADALPDKEVKGILTNGPFANEPIHLEVLPSNAKFSDHEHGDFHEMVDQVVFQDGAFWSEQGGGLGQLALVAPNCEIIGNRHDNPELMKEVV